MSEEAVLSDDLDAVEAACQEALDQNVCSSAVIINILARRRDAASRHSIDVVARQTGFADRDRMRRTFLRAFGHPPQVLIE